MDGNRANGWRGVDLSKSNVSRYLQLGTLFRRRIEQGIWPIGQQIPTVDELAAECNVARATVRQSLDILENEKLIRRSRAKGTFVIEQPQAQIWLGSAPRPGWDRDSFPSVSASS